MNIRDEQLEFGRRQAATEGSSYKPGRETIRLKSSGKKQQPKGHESFLNSLAESRAEITVTDIDGEEFTGRIKNCDQWTISMKVGEDTLVFFKHDLKRFKVGPAPARKDETLN
jgi:RNA chaperone Hfq